MLDATTPPPPLDPRTAADRIPDLRVALLEAQAEIRERGLGMLVLVAGDDRWGCSEVLDRLHAWLDPARLDTVIRLPVTEAERERPFMWRAWRDLPARGRIGLVYGGWPHRLMLDCLRGRHDEAAVDQRLRAVRAFDRLLAASGYGRLRLWIHAREDEHRRRADSARRDPEWKWRLDATDRTILDHWDEVLPVARRLVSETGGAHAPWCVIEGDDRLVRDVQAGERLLAALRDRIDGAPAVPKPHRDDAPRPLAVRDDDGPRLAAIEADPPERVDRDAYHDRLAVLQPRITRRMRQFAEAGQSAVLVVEGPDAAGKGGAIRRITAALPATMERVVRIGAPTEEELARPYLWRFWRQLPPSGHLTVFDRSWYGRVLVERVEGYADAAAWGRAYDEINAFERQLIDHGTAVVKVWLHIDRDEQARRFEARQATGWKRHKITPADWRARERWDDYIAAAEAMFERTDTAAAPWTVIAAGDKKHARLAVLDVLGKTLKKSLWKDRRDRRGSDGKHRRRD